MAIYELYDMTAPLLAQRHSAAERLEKRARAHTVLLSVPILTLQLPRE